MGGFAGPSPLMAREGNHCSSEGCQGCNWVNSGGIGPERIPQRLPQLLDLERDRGTSSQVRVELGSGKREQRVRQTVGW